MDKGLGIEIARRLEASENIMIACHIRPDGDAIGSLLGLGLSLQAAGKGVQMISVDGVPVNYRFLAGSDQITTYPTGAFDMAITVDCSDLRRVGNALDGYPIPDLNIDHHITNENFARINWIDTQATATAEILVKLIQELALPIDQKVAAALLTGIVTDTLGFRTANVSPAVLRTAAELMEFDLSLTDIYQKALKQRSFEAIRFWATGLGRIERQNGIVWTSLTLADRKAVGYPGRDDADLINVLSAITDSEIALIFVEQPNDLIKVSWRARPGLDVTPVAKSFGGGGHPAAAGAQVNGELEAVIARVLQATRALIENHAIEMVAG